ncbi:hypothetical protein VMCG_07317 [Cytospora schulzeri]|uniref:Endonuclease/exonuclease/phosphatase domain-containing protein n=1 Tax=Cytospora schulzeri TaxID=448051 RepID=A0A423WAN0_9PEZI|nr:hypothetical protein VMCG_07317 [Valsa malicola]
MASSSLIASLTQKQMTRYQPKPQPHYTFNGSKWHLWAMVFRNLKLITWNIDFMAPFPQARMASALSYLQGLVENIPKSTAEVICLQELRQDVPTDFEHLKKQLDPQIADDLGQREDLMVDIVVKLPSEAGGQEPETEDGNDNKRSVIRVCNVHLDFMAGKPPMRPVQWKACAKYMQDKSDGVVTGIVAGDCNADRVYDLTLALENGFKDAYLEPEGSENDPDEMDSEGVPLQLKSLERIGVGVKVDDVAVVEQLAEAGYLGYVTDHYGLMADFKVSDGWTLNT